MILKAYSVYDRKALQYYAPFFQSTDGQAVRALQDLATDINTNVGRHPGDYVLYCVGQYDDSKGAMIPLSPLAHIVDAISLVPISKQPDLPWAEPDTNAWRVAHQVKE